MTLEASIAQPVMWVWPCCQCGQIVHILAIRGTLETKNPCEHFVLARASGEKLAVEYAREVAEPVRVLRMRTE